MKFSNINAFFRQKIMINEQNFEFFIFVASQKFKHEALNSDIFNNENVELLNVNESRVVQSKNRSIKVKNKKSIMSRVERKKSKLMKRDLFDFEHIEIVI